MNKLEEKRWNTFKIVAAIVLIVVVVPILVALILLIGYDAARKLEAVHSAVPTAQAIVSRSPIERSFYL